VTAKRLVLDASVALKWILRDEEATSQADALLADVLAGQLSLIVPSLFDYEIANALAVAVAKGRLDEAKAWMALADFQFYSIKRVNFPTLQDNAFQLALRHHRSVYDSAYVALAQSLDMWLFTGDKRLFNALGGALDWVKWIGDYQFDAIPEVEGAVESS